MDIKDCILELPGIVEEFDTLRESYNGYISNGNFHLDSLKLYRTKFCDIRSAIRPIKSSILFLKMAYDDKSATSYKARVMYKILKKENTEFSDLKVNLSVAREMAPASEDYVNFLKDRAVYYQAYDEIAGLREDLQNFINEVTGRINTFWGTRDDDKGED